MKALLYFSLLFPLATLSGLAQNTVGTQFNYETKSLLGYTLFSPRTSETPRFTYLMDNCGKIVNQWESEFSLFSTDYLLEDGSLFRSVVDNQSTLAIPGNTGRIEHLTWDNDVIWARTISETDFSFHHDYVVLENGNILLLIAFRMSLQDALDAGRDPSTIATDELYEERIWEITPEGTDEFSIIWEWRSWDHLIQDFDATKENFGDVALNPQKVDINYGVSFGEADWWHSNSLSYNPDRDHITVSNRNLDEFLIIDHSTTTGEASGSTGGNSGRGGDILYRYGNPEAYRQGSIEDRTLHAMHDVHFIQEGSPNAGKIQIFNNNPALGASEILIIDPVFDEETQNYTYDGGAFSAGTIAFSYTDPDNFFAAFLSGSQELPNGNFLITNGPFAELFEITPEGETVWQYFSPVANSGILSDGDDPSISQTRVYRSLKYAEDYPGLEGRDLTPGDPIEMNPVEDGCQTLALDEFQNADSFSQILPNPIINTLRLQSEKEVVALNVYDITGRTIKTTAGTSISMQSAASGLYLVTISYKDNSYETLKFLKK